MITYALVNDVRFCFHMRGNRRAEWCVPNTCDVMQVAISAFGKEMDRYTQSKWTSGGLTVESVLPNPDQGILHFLLN